jgi:hypothetical protein
MNGYPDIIMDSSGTANNPVIRAGKSGVLRWAVNMFNNDAEGGSNSGANFEIDSFTDAGGALAVPLKIARATGIATFSAPIVNGSDVALKENISPITGALAKVLRLDGVKYNQIGQKRTDIGLVAQAVKKVVPEVVFNTTTDGGKESLGIAYSQLVALLVNAIKELNDKVDALESRK